MWAGPTLGTAEAEEPAAVLKEPSSSAENHEVSKSAASSDAS